MKKNILTLVILVLTFANLILTAIMMFTVVPSTKKTDKLVTDICSVLDLELASDKKDKVNKVDLKNLDFYNVSDEITVRLKSSGDTDETPHYAVLMIGISMNTKHKDYKKYGADMDTRASLIRNAVQNVVGAYTYEEALGKNEELQEKILEALHEEFDSDFIYQVLFNDIKIQ